MAVVSYKKLLELEKSCDVGVLPVTGYAPRR